MRCIRSTYELERIRDPGPALTDALSLYSRHVSSAIRTATNDIVFWASEYNRRFGDELFLFALRLNGQIVGFAEMVFFSEQQLLVIDYMVIKEGHRHHSAFFQFADHIRDYLDTHGVRFNAAVTEIGNFSEGDQPSDESRKLIRLLKLLGFGVLKARYYQPPLGLSNPESLMRSTLMILRDDSRDAIKRETFLRIVRTIYYSHYLRWYEPLPGCDSSAYRKEIDGLFALVESHAPEGSVRINGWPDMCPDQHDGDPAGGLVLASSGAYVAMVLCVILVLAWVGFAFNLGCRSLAVLVVISLVTVLAILSVFSRRAMGVFNKVLASLHRLLRRSR
jgi:hypothetical protein